MEHDQSVCPGCGGPAGVHSFCQSCRSHMDSLAGSSSSAAAHAGDSIYPATRALREVLRLEEALAAASKGISERIAARASAAVEVEPDPLSATGTELVPETVHALRDVARLEDVLTVAPTGGSELTATDRAATALPEPPQIQTDEPALVEQVDSPTRAEEHRLEQTHVGAAALREAFWFEQAQAFKPSAASHPAPEAVAGPAPYAADPIDVVNSSPSDGDPESDPEPSAEYADSPSPLELWLGRARSTWPAALWLLTLVALVALLTGRRRRHLI